MNEKSLKPKDLKCAAKVVYRRRRKTYPPLPTSQQETRESAENEHRNKQNFLQVNDAENGIIIFTCISNLQCLCDVSEIFMDGTFRCCLIDACVGEQLKIFGVQYSTLFMIYSTFGTYRNYTYAHLLYTYIRPIDHNLFSKFSVHRHFSLFFLHTWKRPKAAILVCWHYQHCHSYDHASPDSNLRHN